MQLPRVSMSKVPVRGPFADRFVGLVIRSSRRTPFWSTLTGDIAFLSQLTGCGAWLLEELLSATETGTFLKNS